MSQERFEVGEVAVYIGRAPRRRGTECVINTPLAMVTCYEIPLREVNTKPRYSVTFQDGHKVYAQSSKLRKKKPPREDLQVVRWADVPWQPERMKA